MSLVVHVVVCVLPAEVKCAAVQPGQGGVGAAGWHPTAPVGAGEEEPPG